MRLHLESISAGVTRDESSILILLCLNLSLALKIFFQSFALSLPDSAEDILTFAALHKSLWIICTSGISKEKTTQTASLPSAAFSIIFIAIDVLPIPGRAAITIKSDFCNPFVSLSSLVNPVGIPRNASLSFASFSNLSRTAFIPLPSRISFTAEVSFVFETLYIRSSANCTLFTLSSLDFANSAISRAARIKLLFTLSRRTISR